MVKAEGIDKVKLSAFDSRMALRVTKLSAFDSRMLLLVTVHTNKRILHL